MGRARSCSNAFAKHVDSIQIGAMRRVPRPLPLQRLVQHGLRPQSAPDGRGVLVYVNAIKASAVVLDRYAENLRWQEPSHSSTSRDTKGQTIAAPSFEVGGIAAQPFARRRAHSTGAIRPCAEEYQGAPERTPEVCGRNPQSLMVRRPYSAGAFCPTRATWPTRGGASLAQSTPVPRASICSGFVCPVRWEQRRPASASGTVFRASCSQGEGDAQDRKGQSQQLAARDIHEVGAVKAEASDGPTMAADPAESPLLFCNGDQLELQLHNQAHDLAEECRATPADESVPQRHACQSVLYPQGHTGLPTRLNAPPPCLLRRRDCRRGQPGTMPWRGGGVAKPRSIEDVMAVRTGGAPERAQVCTRH